MSLRSVRRVDLGAIYKLSRFVGHGVLHRAEEGAKRLKRSPDLAKGFTTPVDVESLGSNGDLCARALRHKEKREENRSLISLLTLCQSMPSKRMVAIGPLGMPHTVSFYKRHRW
jgi:hypothetical protein